MPFINCISRINYTQVDDTYDIDVVMRMYNLLHIVIFIQKHLEFYGNIAEMNQLYMLIMLLPFLMQIMPLLIRLKLKKKLAGETGSNGTKIK